MRINRFTFWRTDKTTFGRWVGRAYIGRATPRGIAQAQRANRRPVKETFGRLEMLDLLAMIIAVAILAVFGYGIWKLISELP